jgi:hypothetical protein
MRGYSTRASDLIATSPVSKVAALSHLYVDAEVVDESPPCLRVRHQPHPIHRRRQFCAPTLSFHYALVPP